MKNLIIVVLLLVTSCNSKSQEINDTVDFIKYKLESNPPFDGVNTTFKFFNEGEEKGDERLVYIIEMLDNNKEVVNSKTSTVYINEIKNILLEQAMYNSQLKYSLRLGINQNSNSKSFAVAYNGQIQNAKINELAIVLPNNKELAEKLKRGIIRLGDFKGVEITDLDLVGNE